MYENSQEDLLQEDHLVTLDQINEALRLLKEIKEDIQELRAHLNEA